MKEATSFKLKLMSEEEKKLSEFLHPFSLCWTNHCPNGQNPISPFAIFAILYIVYITIYNIYIVFYINTN